MHGCNTGATSYIRYKYMGVTLHGGVQHYTCRDVRRHPKGSLFELSMIVHMQVQSSYKNMSNQKH